MMQTDSAPAIEVEGLWHTYLAGTPQASVALRDVCLVVRPGESVGIIGPTGSGKSTLLQHLNGLLRPQRGRVFVYGIPLHEPKTELRRIRQRVGLLLQSPEDQLFERYAGDDVAFGPRNLGLGKDQVRESVRQAMQECGLPFLFKDRLTMELSQGERRRLALAGVMAMNPQVLLLDEPTAGLDPQGRLGLLRMLAEWRKQGEHALVLASHNMEDIAQLADRIYVLVGGQVVLEGTARQVFSCPEILAEAGLATPPATQVLQGLHQRGIRVPQAALTLEEATRQIEALFHG